MSQLSKSQLRVLYFYEWRRGVAVTSAAYNINNVYGSSTTTDRTVHNWYRRSQQGERHLEDQPHHCQPLLVEYQALREAIREDPETTIREIATKLGCTYIYDDKKAPSRPRLQKGVIEMGASSPYRVRPHGSR